VSRTRVSRSNNVGNAGSWSIDFRSSRQLAMQTRIVAVGNTGSNCVTSRDSSSRRSRDNIIRVDPTWL